MSYVNVRLSVRELRLLATLASDQLFQREFIDPRFPGHKSDPEELNVGKELVKRLQGALERNERMPLAMKTGGKL